MAIFLVIKGRDNGKELIDGVDAAVVEAANAGAAVTAANALDARFGADYFPAGSATDIESVAYLGGTFKVIDNNGV
jgi:hypothetical protein